MKGFILATLMVAFSVSAAHAETRNIVLDKPDVTLTYTTSDPATTQEIVEYLVLFSVHGLAVRSDKELMDYSCFRDKKTCGVYFLKRMKDLELTLEALLGAQFSTGHPLEAVRMFLVERFRHHRKVHAALMLYHTEGHPVNVPGVRCVWGDTGVLMECTEAKMPEYPAKAWQQTLKRHGLKETVKYKESDCPAGSCG